MRSFKRRGVVGRLPEGAPAQVRVQYLAPEVRAQWAGEARKQTRAIRRKLVGRKAA